MDDNRTMIAGNSVPLRAEPQIIAGIHSPGQLDIMVLSDGTQYAKLPEGWPATEDKDLEEAHAEAVASDEPFLSEEQLSCCVTPEGEMSEWERELYTFTPEEVKAL